MTAESNRYACVTYTILRAVGRWGGREGGWIITILRSNTHTTLDLSTFCFLSITLGEHCCNCHWHMSCKACSGDLVFSIRLNISCTLLSLCINNYLIQVYMHGTTGLLQRHWQESSHSKECGDASVHVARYLLILKISIGVLSFLGWRECVLPFKVCAYRVKREQRSIQDNITIFSAR